MFVREASKGSEEAAPKEEQSSARKHLCNHTRPQWEASSIWSVQTHLPAGDKGPGPAQCRELVRSGDEVSWDRYGTLSEEAGGTEPQMGRGRHLGEAACGAQPGMASPPATLIP